MHTYSPRAIKRRGTEERGEKRVSLGVNDRLWLTGGDLASHAHITEDRSIDRSIASERASDRRDRSLALPNSRDRVIDVGRAGARRPESALRGRIYLSLIRATNDTCDGISISATAPSAGKRILPISRRNDRRSLLPGDNPSGFQR